jgi:EmrB/QacA subfamily drug resistance transporter
MRKYITTLILTCLAQFIVIVDLAIVNVALPTIQQQLSMSQSTLQWIVVAYGLLFGGFLLLGGRLGDVLGRRRVLLIGLGLFSVASLAAGLADSATLLIAARALQGFGAAMIAPSALSILATTFKEGKERNSALGIFGATGGLAGSVGVLAGGLITDGPGWQWIFFINVPIGIALIGLALRYLPAHRVEKGARRFSVGGAASITAGLIALVYGLTQGTESGWSSPITLGSFVIAAALLATFVRIESRSRSPLVNFEIFKNRLSAGSMITGLFAFGSLFSFIFTTSLLMQQQLHYTPTQTGAAWLITSVTSFVVAMFTGSKLVAKLGVKRLLVASLALMVLAMLWLTRMPASATFLADVFPALLLAGVGSGMMGPVIQISALTGVQPKHFGLISGVVETMRELGSVIVIAAVSTAFAVQTSPLGGFHAAYLIIAISALLGLGTVGIAFQKKRTRQSMSQKTLAEAQS